MTRRKNRWPHSPGVVRITRTRIARRSISATAPRYSYWVGCSTGGRQGFSEAQRYPEDFDGLVIGAPAISITGLNMRMMWNAQAAHSGPGKIPAAKLPLLADAVYKKCDKIDGLEDGLIDDPANARSTPATIFRSVLPARTARPVSLRLKWKR